MIREIRKKTLRSKIQKVAFSPFIFPFLTFAFVILTLPIVIILLGQQQDIRQRAATVTNGPFAIDTTQVSYGSAIDEVVTTDFISLAGLITGLLLIAVIAIAVIFVRKKVGML